MKTLVELKLSPRAIGDPSIGSTVCSVVSESILALIATT